MSYGMPPSTPNSRSVRTFTSHQSTTPAGPPPTYLFSAASNTPAGEPPRSSRFGSSYNPIKKSPNRFARKAFTVPDDDDEYDEYDDEEDAAFEHDDDGIVDQAAVPQSSPPRGLKRDHTGEVRDNSVSANELRRAYQSKGPAGLRETDHVILESERVVSDLEARIRSQRSKAENILTQAAADLTKLWAQAGSVDTVAGGIGPRSNEPFVKANYLASLLLQLHFPHTHKPQTTASRPGRALVSAAQPPCSIPMPQALLDWLNTYHTPFPDDFDTIHLFRPSPSAHESFWDSIYASLLRGKLDRVIRLLKDAGWEHAATAPDDQADEGYTDRQLDCIEEVVGDCVKVLGECPGHLYQDWDVKSTEWTVFRQRARAMCKQLEAFAETDDMGDSTGGDNVFQRGNDSMGLSTASRHASSKVPWSIYDNLRLVYMILCGQPDELLMTAQDWLEASLYLTIWWDGNEDDTMTSLSKSSMRRSHVHRTREVDVAPLVAYRRKLASALARVETEAKVQQEDNNGANGVFALDSMNHMHNALACILQDIVGGALYALRSYSTPIAVSVVELAALGGWLPLVRPRSAGGLLEQGFDKEDLLVLSHGPTHKTPNDQDRDEILEQYADLLSARERIGDKEGWELAVTVLNRLDQPAEANRKIGDLLQKLQLTSEDTVDRVLGVCDRLGQKEQLQSIAERYADELAENNTSHGAALIYYARAHATDKLKNTVTFLTSLCILHSTSIPAKRLLDAKLDGLLSSDRPALRELGRVDIDAASLLASHLSGYATLRKFYDLRDQLILNTKGKSLKPLERKRQAATALFAVIKSAADCIPGGLYDPEAETVVSVDGTLALLGEALELLGQEQRIFTEQQVFSLLATLEDFVAAPSRIKENAESLLKASLNAYREDIDTATGPLKRKKSNLSESSWDMMATSSMMAASQGLKKGEKIQRAWDWRHRLAERSIDGSEKEVVRIVREALVKEVAGGWGGKLNWQQSS